MLSFWLVGSLRELPGSGASVQERSAAKVVVVTDASERALDEKGTVATLRTVKLSQKFQEEISIIRNAKRENKGCFRQSQWIGV